MVHVNISPTNFLRFLFFCLFKIGIPFALEFHLHSISMYASICVVTFQILLIFFFLSSIEVQ
jgi:hypothetical protein